MVAVSPAPANVEFDDRTTLADVLREVIEHSPGGRRWSVRIDETWAHADVDAPLPVQGWKLHLTATVGNAQDVLRACAAVLLDAGCPFKVARDLRRVEALTSPHCPRENAGKVITAYPADDVTAVELARRLDEATRGFSGPRILSDRPLREGSLVHYRYGVFTGVPHVSHDGEVSAALLAPDGRPVIDRRAAGTAAPSWVTCPFASDGAPDRPAQRQVLLGDRFAVREAIRHANRGGVFRATDQLTGRRVVVKQARAHVASDAAGIDARDRLRHEARVLETLAGTGLVPELVSVFEQGGDLFVAEQDLGGRSLRSWVSAGTVDGVVTRPHESTRHVLARAATVLAALHDAGIVVRDFNPNNIVITEDDRPVLVDLELAVLPDAHTELFARSGTPAYSAPEQLDGALPDVRADCHALGATVLFAFTGEDPYLGGPGPSSLFGWLRHGVRHLACPPSIAELALALCAPDPAARPTSAEAAALLKQRLPAHRPLTSARAVQSALDDVRPLDDGTADSAVDALVERLLLDVRPEPGRVARASTFGETTLATNVQHGAAGLLGVLVQAWNALGDDRLRTRVADVAQWLDTAVERQPADGPVGLYFGYAGPCWALADAGHALGDAGIVDRAVTRALALPTGWPGPDVTHGISGLGLTLVHLWQLTHDPRLRKAVHTVGVRLLATAESEGQDVSWRTPREARSTFAGSRYYGYAHGTAGIALFLQHAALVGDESEFHGAAASAAATLQRAALRAERTSTWGSGPDDPTPGLPHWCNGSSGVATFLVRHAALGGDVDGQLLHESARAVVANKWRSGIAYCHGLSGNADLMLDLAEHVDNRYSEWASDVLRVMWDRHTSDARGIGLTDEPGRVTPDFNVGYGGALSALLRLRRGGPRAWLPELTP